MKLIFQHLPVKEKINNSNKNNRMEEMKRMRKSVILDTLTSVGIVEIVKCGGFILEICEGFFCHNSEMKTYTKFVSDLVEKRHSYYSQGWNLVQNIAKKRLGYQSTWYYYFDDRVREWFPLKNGNSVVKLENDKKVDDHEKAKSINTMPSHFGSYILSHIKRLMNEVNYQKRGFYSISIFYGDSSSMYINKNYWSPLVDNGLVGKSFGLCKNDYGSSGKF